MPSKSYKLESDSIIQPMLNSDESDILLLSTNSKYDHLLPRPLNIFAGRDLHEIEVEAHELSAQRRKKPLASRSNTGVGPGPVLLATSTIVVETRVPSVQGADDVAPATNANARSAATTSTASGAPVRGVNGSATLPQKEDPSVKKLTAAIAEGLEATTSEVPKFKHVPGIGLIPETPTSPDQTVFGTANGDSAHGNEDNEGGARATPVADAVANDDTNSTAAPASTVGDSAAPEDAPPTATPRWMTTGTRKKHCKNRRPTPRAMVVRHQRLAR